MTFLGATSGKKEKKRKEKKNLPANADMQERHPWVGKIPWGRAWKPIPVFLPGESPWTEEPGGLQTMGSQRIGHD